MPKNNSRYHFEMPGSELQSQLDFTENIGDFTLADLLRHGTGVARQYSNLEHDRKDFKNSHSKNRVNSIYSNYVNLTTDLDNIFKKQNHKGDKGRRYIADAELSTAWLETKMAYIDSLDRVTDWLRILGAPNFSKTELLTKKDTGKGGP